ncbi:MULTISPECIES: trypsin-like peptidase domain-containing protein [unclassified Sphingopyxis]|uniref:trypsin-like peptidase domain-containing protein n=1 Tax=unclassified Sphingopyxis TaxID=2614943 RepID=UPI0024AE2D57|nr:MULTISPECIES: trypsin-like peptidase domain-containing protein [unclassified Sphingopyxis]
MTAPGVDSCSLVPLFVEAYFRDQRLGVGTAFPWLLPDTSLALITNWHVAAGRNHETDACLHPMAGVPDHLRVHVPQNERSDAPYIVSVATMDAEGRPLWTEHPTLGRGVDVVALAFVPPPNLCLMPLNAMPMVSLKQRVSMPVFILGFPFGRTGMGMPVWKQATFASEPCLAPHLDKPYFIVDSASRPGMSGSPVIQRAHGNIELEDGRIGTVGNGDGAFNFVGIYSGRFHTEDVDDAQLGRVWPRALLEEILTSHLTAKS